MLAGGETKGGSAGVVNVAVGEAEQQEPAAVVVVDPPAVEVVVDAPPAEAEGAAPAAAAVGGEPPAQRPAVEGAPVPWRSGRIRTSTWKLLDEH